MSLAQKQLFRATRLQAYLVRWTQWVLDNDLFPGLGCREKDFEANSGGHSSRIFERFGTSARRSILTSFPNPEFDTGGSKGSAPVDFGNKLIFVDILDAGRFR